jgi:uncharacterized protein (TIGR02145 family)
MDVACNFYIYKNIKMMKGYYTNLLSAMLLLVLVSCTEESNSKQSTDAQARNVNPIQIGEVRILVSDYIFGEPRIWMTKNLNTSRYRNGDPIPQVTDPEAWVNLTTGAWCYYNNDPANGPKYGKLYNWYAVNDPRGLAPAGWHVPSRSDFWYTIDYYNNDSFWDYERGGDFKSLTGWDAPNLGATNNTGFSGLPGGKREYGGGTSPDFVAAGYLGVWWLATPQTGNNIQAHYFNLNSYSSEFTDGVTPKYMGFSVRCVRD